MNISENNPISPIKQPNAAPSAERLRQAAMQFEAILLMQLTSALNSTTNEDDESLFGSDAGSGMAKQLFSEQMATSLAQSGGVGLADLIISQFGTETKTGAGKIKGLSEIVSSVKNLAGKESAAPKLLENHPLPPISERLTAGDPNDAAIISTFEDDLRANGIDEATKNLMLEGKVVNSTRARIVPDAPVAMADNMSWPSNSAPLREIVFQKPAVGRVSSNFGTRFHPIDKTSKFHGGMDIAIPTGTPVSSAGEGTVVFAGRKGGYGNLVIIDHPDGRQTRYAHLSSISVAAGDPVSIGQPIALSGSTGKSTGPHLHFEVRENGKPVDPRLILSNVLPKLVEK